MNLKETLTEKSYLPHYAMILQTLAVSPGYTFGTWAATVMPPAAMLQLRLICTGAICWLLLAAQGKSLGLGKISRNEWAQMLGLALIGAAGNQFCFIMGLRYTTPASLALIFACMPLVILFIAVVLRKSERLTRSKLAGALLAVLGVFVVIGATADADVKAANPLLGNLFGLGAITFWAFYMTYSKDMVARLGSLEFTTLLICLGALVLAPYGLYEVAQFDFSAMTPKAWFGFGYITVMNAVVSYVLLMFALSALAASRVSVYLNAQPAVAAIFSYVMGYETLSLLFAGGTLLTIAGIYVLNRARH